MYPRIFGSIISVPRRSLTAPYSTTYFVVVRIVFRTRWPCCWQTVYKIWDESKSMTVAFRLVSSEKKGIFHRCFRVARKECDVYLSDQISLMTHGDIWSRCTLPKQPPLSEFLLWSICVILVGDDMPNFTWIGVDYDSVRTNWGIFHLAVYENAIISAVRHHSRGIWDAGICTHSRWGASKSTKTKHQNMCAVLR